MAHNFDALVLLDGAQAAPHMPIDVQDLDGDFFVFSGHKMYGPIGIGILHGKAELLSAMLCVFPGYSLPLQPNTHRLSTQQGRGI